MTKPSSKTAENLKEAFALEAQSIRRYLYFAAKADFEGYNDVAVVFRQIAESERAAADEMLALLDAAEDTRAALEAAIASESASSAETFPAMARTAREEGETAIADFFDPLAKADKGHASRFQKALGSLG